MRPLSLRHIPVRQHILQPTLSRSQHTILIRLDRHNLHALRLRLAEDVAIDKCLAQQPRTLPGVVKTVDPGVDEHLERLGEAVGRAAGEDHIRAAAVRRIRVEVIAGELANPVEEWRVAVCLTVLQRCGDVHLLHGVGLTRDRGDGDVSGLCRRVLFGLVGSRVIRGGLPSLGLCGLGFESLKGEEFGVW